MIERRAGRDQLAHHAGVAQVRGRDQRRAVVAAGHLGRARAQRQQQAQGLLVVRDRGDGHRVVAVAFQQVQVGAGLCQCPDGIALPGEGGDVQRRAPMRIARVEVGARRNQPGDPGGVAALSGGVQALVGRRLRGARADLGAHGWRERRQRDGHRDDQRLHFSMSFTFSMPAIAHCSSRLPAGAPPTPTAPITSLPTRTGTPPPSSRKPGR